MPGIFTALGNVPPLVVIIILPGVDVSLEFKFVAILNKLFLYKLDELEDKSCGDLSDELTTLESKDCRR